MKKRIKHVLSQKKYVRALAIVLIAVIAYGAYMVHTVYSNVQAMVTPENSAQYYPPYPTVNTQGKDAALIQRGEYLAKAGDCIACHTNTQAKGTAFAGGLVILTPFGKIYSPNITSDPENGIGKWTQSEFNRAMREGVAPDGHYYYPAFPYIYFNKVSDDDLRALKAYLDSIPAVATPNQANEMIFPFNIRFLQLGWRILFFRGEESSGPVATNPQQTAQWNRGEYLVQGLGHCSMCHTPSYNIFTPSLPLAAPIRKYDLTGAMINGYLAPNIAKSNLGTTVDTDITQVFSADKMIGGGNIAGPMLEVNHDSLHYLNQDDMVAIATYIKSVNSASPPKPKSTGGGPGKAVYEGYCAGCHTMGAGGSPKLGDAAAWDPRIKNGMSAVYNNAIKGFNGMPAKGTCMSCSDDDIKQAVDYMVNASKGSAAEKSNPAVAPMKPLTMADGKRIYDESCAVCHNVGFKHAPNPGDLASCKPMIDGGFVNAYKAVVDGNGGHPVRGACDSCTDADLKAAVKYLMQQGTNTKDYNLW